MNILVISSNLIGDSILCTGIIKNFIENYPNSKLTIISGPTSAQVFFNFPNVRKIIRIKKNKFKTHWFQIWKKCLFIKWDIIIDFRSSLLSYILFRKKSYIFKRSDNIHQLDQLDNFFKPKTFPHPTIYNNKDEEKFSSEKIISSNKYLVVSPGGNWNPKIWDACNFNKLLILLLRKYENLNIVIVGSLIERQKYNDILINNIDKDKIIDITNKNITETFAVIKRCNLFIGNDSGLMHLSTASKISTIGLFGPTNDKLYSPYGKNCYVIRTKESYDYFMSMSIDKSKSYMNSIKYEDVSRFIEQNNLL